jgi:hypothetical protein
MRSAWRADWRTADIEEEFVAHTQKMHHQCCFLCLGSTQEIFCGAPCGGASPFAWVPWKHWKQRRATGGLRRGKGKCF